MNAIQLKHKGSRMNNISIAKQHQYFSFKDFSQLDESNNIDYLVSSMQNMLKIDGIREVKHKAIKLLRLNPGESVIEFGCGLGHDAEILSEYVKPHGNVVGIDSSLSMLNAAKKYSTRSNIQFHHGKINELSFLPDSFDAAYADRVLVSQPNFSKTFSNMVRFLKPKGRICITDLDYGSIILYPFNEKVSQAIKTRFHEITENPLIGRELSNLFYQENLINIHVCPTAYSITSLDLFNSCIADLDRIITDLILLGKITQEEGNNYKNALVNADRNNMFSYTVTLFTVCGEKTG